VRRHYAHAWQLWVGIQSPPVAQRLMAVAPGEQVSGWQDSSARVPHPALQNPVSPGSGSVQILKLRIQPPSTDPPAACFMCCRVSVWMVVLFNINFLLMDFFFIVILFLLIHNYKSGNPMFTKFRFTTHGFPVHACRFLFSLQKKIMQCNQSYRYK
jgi:hypothetical protein